MHLVCGRKMHFAQQGVVRRRVGGGARFDGREQRLGCSRGGEAPEECIAAAFPSGAARRGAQQLHLQRRVHSAEETASKNKGTLAARQAPMSAARRTMATMERFVTTHRGVALVGRYEARRNRSHISRCPAPPPPPLLSLRKRNAQHPSAVEVAANGNVWARRLAPVASASASASAPLTGRQSQRASCRCAAVTVHSSSNTRTPPPPQRTLRPAAAAHQNGAQGGRSPHQRAHPRRGGVPAARAARAARAQAQAQARSERAAAAAAGAGAQARARG